MLVVNTIKKWHQYTYYIATCKLQTLQGVTKNYPIISQQQPILVNFLRDIYRLSVLTVIYKLFT